MSRTFYFLLRETNFNWDLARRVFYNLNDQQIVWLNKMLKQERRVYDHFGRTEPGEHIIKSFDLRRH